METLILYFGKVIICSGVMFLYYQLSLKDKTFHHYNRFYLLSAMLISILLPLVKVEDFTIEVSNDLYVLLNKLQNFNSNNSTDHDNIYFRIIFSALGLVSLYFLGKLLYGILKIAQFKNLFQKETFEGVNFYQTNLSEAPFSYFKNLFWKNSIILHSDIGKQILKHEMVHIEQKHSYDKIFIEIITSIFWFNPFFHIIKKEISLIHEYLADKKAVKKSDTKAFAQMLLASHFSGKELPATSPFLSSNLKKRLKMLQKPQTKFGYARRIFALPVLFTVAFAYMVNAKNKEIAETNIEIEKAVSEIKKDTISPKSSIDQIVERQEVNISKANEQLKIQSEKLKTLSEKSKEKAAELKKIAKEKGDKSYEFELKAKELEQLSGEMDKIVYRNLNEKDSEIIFNDLEFRTTSPEGKNYTLRLNENRNATVDMTNHEGEGYRNLKKELDNRLTEVLQGEKVYADNNFKRAPTPITPPRTRGYTGVSTYREIKYSHLSQKDQRRLEKLSKEKAELSKKQAEISRKQAEIVRAKAQNNPWMISVDAYATPKADYTVISKYVDSENTVNNKIVKTQNSRVITDGIENSNSGVNKFYINGKDAFEEDMKVIIDGKVVSREDLAAFDAKNIKDMNIVKSKVNGKAKGEIIINTKKENTK
ncbi:M56 family metallopeptidase [Chryseobacterium wangxinyae]|uniref:M56 family metallopeptidase n=1 Tax=Chryseobacterium sp. CY353 TaxID=2997334 RepID=UPI002271AF4F|nr:M56 family metallopeptidase [Chryseobacterium sp. CY353]MCY0968168.1 hypothetical protein [Chryseobacterium sp. CY353]